MKSLEPGLVGMGGGGSTGTWAGSLLLATGGLTGVVLITKTKMHFGELRRHTITGGGPRSLDMLRQSEILASRSMVILLTVVVCEGKTNRGGGRPALGLPFSAEGCRSPR